MIQSNLKWACAHHADTQNELAYSVCGSSIFLIRKWFKFTLKLQWLPSTLLLNPIQFNWNTIWSVEKWTVFCSPKNSTVLFVCKARAQCIKKTHVWTNAEVILGMKSKESIVRWNTVSFNDLWYCQNDFDYAYIGTFLSPEMVVKLAVSSSHSSVRLYGPTDSRVH